MEYRFSLKYWWVPIFFLGSYTGFSQCAQPAEVWLNKLLVIENSEELVQVKINKLQHLQSLYDDCKMEGDSVSARIAHRLGAFYYSAGDYEKGIRYTRQAIEINGAHLPGAQKAFLAHSYYNLGLYYNQLNLIGESLQYFDSCVAIGMQYPEKKFIAMNAFEKKAYSAYITGDYQRSIEIVDNGLLLARDLQNTESEAMLLLQKAQSQIEMNQLPQAENNILVGIQILSKSDMPLEYPAVQYSVYASLLKRKMNFNASIRNYKKAFELNLQQNNLEQCTRDLSDLGLVYDKNLNNGPKAIAYYTKGLQLARQTKDVYQMAIIYNNIGLVHWRQKEYRKALHYYQKGLTVLPIQFTDTLLQNNPSPAMLKQAANDHILSILLSNKGESLLELGKQEQNKAYLVYALSTFKAADKAIDQMRWKQNNTPSKLFWREKTKKMYENAIETCYLLPDTQNAFFFFEKSRAVLLNDKLSELGAQKYLSPTSLAKEQELRIKLLSLQQQLTSLEESTSQYEQARLQWFTTQDAYEKFIKKLEKSSPTYYRYKYDTTTYTIAEVRSQLLSRDQSFIEYFTGDNHIYMLAIKPDTAILSQVDGKSYYAESREMLRLCADKSLLNQNYARYAQLAQNFYKHLFQPLSIQTKKVIISPDDHFIPFEILLTDRANPGSFLLQKHAFRYTYSAGFLIKNNQSQSLVNPTLLGIAPIHYKSYLKQPPLQGADFSLENIKSYFSSAHFLIKEKATKKEFLKSLPLHSVVHLYSHAEADSTGKEPVLYLQDSTFQVSELQRFSKLPTRLIVLSACNTATGKNVRGEGVFSLARGFAAAGIPASVTTLWQIDNQTTYQLSELFFKYLSQGIPSDEALREAKLEFLRTHDKSYELPYFWAASILIGQSDSFLETSKNNFIAVFYITGLTLLVLFITAALLFYRKKQNLKPFHPTSTL